MTIHEHSWYHGASGNFLDLHRNVKHGISRPIGGREIEETKVENVLLDTLYIASIKTPDFMFLDQTPFLKPKKQMT